MVGCRPLMKVKVDSMAVQRVRTKMGYGVVGTERNES